MQVTRGGAGFAAVLAGTVAAVASSVLRSDSEFTLADLALAGGAFGASFTSDRSALIGAWVVLTVWAMILAGPDAAGMLALTSAAVGVWVLRRRARPQL
jgi:hypothetical protein